MNAKLKTMFFTLMMVLLFSSAAFASTRGISPLGVVRVGQNVYIQPGEVVNSDAVAIGGDIYVNGVVNGSAVCIGGNVYINGSVGGDVTCIGGNINLGTQGKINGKSTEIGRDWNIPSKFSNNYFRNITGYYSRKISLSGLVLLFIFSVIVYEIIPKNITGIAYEARSNLGRSLMYGYAALIAIPIITVLLITTIVGIILVPILFLIAYLIFLIGFSSLALYCGKRLGLTVLSKNLSDIWCILIGVVLYQLIKGISFAAIGNILCFFFIYPLTIGLAISTRFGTFRPWKGPDKDEMDWKIHEK